LTSQQVLNFVNSKDILEANLTIKTIHFQCIFKFVFPAACPSKADELPIYVAEIYPSIFVVDLSVFGGSSFLGSAG
jgi:hypothetical protein